MSTSYKLKIVCLNFSSRNISYYPDARKYHPWSTENSFILPIQKQKNSLISIVEPIQHDILITTKSEHQNNRALQLHRREARAWRDIPDIQHRSFFLCSNCQPSALIMETADLRIVWKWRRICFHQLLALVFVQRLNYNIWTYTK